MAVEERHVRSHVGPRLTTLVTVTVTESFCVVVRPPAPLVLVIVVVFEEVSAEAVVFELGDITLFVVARLVEFEADARVEFSVDESTVEFSAGDIAEAAIVIELEMLLFTCV